MRQRAHHEVPGVHAVRWLTSGAKIFRGEQLRLDCGNDGFRNFVLHGEHVS
jgi:hypothetical protein